MRQMFSDFAQGKERACMQDHLTATKTPDGAVVLGVFDGHLPDGGECARQAAEAVKRVAHEQLGPLSLQTRAERMRTVLAWLSTTRFFQEAEGGATATVAIAKDDKVATIHLGDSLAVNYPTDGGYTVLTPPHDATNAAEVARVTALGYTVVEKNGKPCFRSDEADLYVSRALGDSLAPFVSNKPEVAIHTITEPGTLLVATDGIWGAHPPDDIAQLLKKHAADKPDLSVASFLLGESYGYGDDIAIIAQQRH